jgi:hypothetical protein
VQHGASVVHTNLRRKALAVILTIPTYEGQMGVNALDDVYITPMAARGRMDFATISITWKQMYATIKLCDVA